MSRARLFFTLLALALLVALLSVLFFGRLGKESHSQVDLSTAEPIVTSPFTESGTGITSPDSGALLTAEALGAGAPQSNAAGSADLRFGRSNHANALAQSNHIEGKSEFTDLVAPSNSPSLGGTNGQNATPLEWVWISPGKFLIGSPEAEPGRRSNEGPQTEVAITHGLWLAKYEVTLGLFCEVTGTPGSRPWPRGATAVNLAFANASWSEATKFCTALTARERAAGRLPDGYVCRLPTEAEWEYACRAGTVTRFSFGDDDGLTMLDSCEWYFANSNGAPQPVGGKQPNPWGLFDMHGNVSEWCLDFLGTYPGGSVTNPVGVIGGPFFVTRGGSWRSRAEGCRSAWRYSVRDIGEFGVIDGGFRAALALPVP